MAAKQPLTVEVTRGDMVESRHRAAAVVMDAAGKALHSWGDVGRLVYPRSAIKPLQTLALIESGAAERFAVSDAEIALASASHDGTPAHTGAVADWLARLSLSERDLECGAHAPMDEEAAHALVQTGRAPGPLCNNCSGKHAGFLTTARHLGEPTAGYIKASHPVQERLKEILGQMGSADLVRAPTGVDGCGIPVYAMPLASLAKAFARMADGDRLEAGRARAAKRIVVAMMANPVLVAGRGRFDTRAMEAGVGAFAAKGGAEGVHVAIVPSLGLGVALKVDDGAKRAAEVAMTAILNLLGVLPDGSAKPFLATPVVNAAGARVGVVRMAKDWNK
jgi:L-asparaginase II